MELREKAKDLAKNAKLAVIGWLGVDGIKGSAIELKNAIFKLVLSMKNIAIVSVVVIFLLFLASGAFAADDSRKLKIKQLEDGSLVLPREELDRLIEILNSYNASLIEVSEQRDKALKQLNMCRGAKFI